MILAAPPISAGECVLVKSESVMTTSHNDFDTTVHSASCHSTSVHENSSILVKSKAISKKSKRINNSKRKRANTTILDEECDYNSNNVKSNSKNTSNNNFEIVAVTKKNQRKASGSGPTVAGGGIPNRKIRK